MVGIRWLLFLNLASSAWLATSNKAVVAQIQCAVCKIAVKEAKATTLREDEDALTDAVENLCKSSKDEGKWTAHLDIFQRDGEDKLTLDRRDEEGVCRDECKSVQRACALSLRGSEEKLVSLIMDGAGAGKLQREVCKKACQKVLPELGKWNDEKFEAASKTTMPDPPAPPAKKDIDIVEDFTALMPDVVASALAELGANSDASEIKKVFSFPTKVGSVPLPDVKKVFLDMIKTATDEMLNKKLEDIRSGLHRLSGALIKLAGNLQEWCSEEVSTDFEVFKALGSLMIEHVERKEVEYKAMESLKVGGHDLHLPLNTLLGALKRAPADGQAFGKALAGLFSVFSQEWLQRIQQNVADSEAGSPKSEL